MAHREYYGIRAASRVDALSIAAANSMLKEMQQLLDDGTDINGITTGYLKTTPLAGVASLGFIRSVDFLIQHGADVNRPGQFGLTPLMLACSTGMVKGSRVALRLITAGADVNYVRVSDEMTALKFAAESCMAEVIQALIDHGAEVDGPHGTKQSALMLAARANHVEALKVLVANGADINRPCLLKWAERRTAEGLAILEKQKKAAAFLASVRKKQSKRK